MQEPSRFDPASLRRIPVFRDLPDDDIALLAGVVCRVGLASGSVIQRHGAPSSAFVIVIEGNAEVSRDGEVIASLQAGDHIGDRSVFEEGTAATTVVAVGDVVIDQVSASDLHHVITTNPDLAWRLLRSLTGRSADHPNRR